MMCFRFGCIATLIGCQAPMLRTVPAEPYDRPTGAVSGEYLFVSVRSLGRTTVHRLPTLEVIGTWLGPEGATVQPVGDLDGDGVPEQVYSS